MTSNLPDHRMSCDGNFTEIRKGVYGEPTVMTGVREHKVWLLGSLHNLMELETTTMVHKPEWVLRW